MESIGTMFSAGAGSAAGSAAGSSGGSFLSSMMPTVLSSVAQGMNIGGQIVGGQAADESGRRKRIAADYEAAQLEQNAGQQVASAQRTAMENKRQADLAMSRALAVAAASGGGASDPTIINLMARLAGEGTYRSMVSLYEGEDRARVMRDQASAKRYSGAMAEDDARAAGNASRFGAVSTAMKGAVSMYSRFGKATDPSAAKVASGYEGTWTANGPMNTATYDKQIWD